MPQIAVIGGGAAGLMAAGRAAACGAAVTLYEKNPFCGKKLRITGKGRCNVCNDCDVNTVLEHVQSGNPRFLYAALNAFSPADVKAFFEERGVPLKTERGNRVFPVSDKAADIAEALRRFAADAGVRFVHAAVRAVQRTDGGFLVETDGGARRHDRVIVATGGASYPLTGSTGDGFRFAKELGLSVTPLRPSLVPLETEEGDAAAMQGLSLRNTALTVTDRESGKVVYTDFGEMLFTHYGVTGPMILSASAHLRDIRRGRYVLHLNFKPALDDETLDARLLADFGKYANRDFANALGDLLPQKLIPAVVRRSGIDPQKKVNGITRAERQALTAALRDFTLTVKRARPLAEAIVTAGGVELSEVSPKTMEAKKIPGLYFCGEVLDLDAYTGGFNLQIAFSTGYLAGESAAWS